MRKLTENFLKLFFNEGEEICVQDDKYAYHSVSQDSLKGQIKLISKSEKVLQKERYITERDISLVSLNPIKGFRLDKNTTAFRSFLVEIDEGRLVDQQKYIEESGLPYSICVFSGNKSLHYGIVLSSDLVSLQVWRHINKWILNILSKADQQTLNPTRNIRFPGNRRKDGKQMVQSLVDIRGRVALGELFAWLSRHPDKKPKDKKPPILNPDFVAEPIVAKLPKYFHEMVGRLKNGEQPNRNSSWFHVACIMARYNFTLESMVSYLSKFFYEEDDFSEREWVGCIKSGYQKESKDG